MLPLAPKNSTQSAHRHALHVKHPVEAIRPAARLAVPGQFALAKHDVVLILLLALPVRVDILVYELPDRRPCAPHRLPCRRLWLLLHVVFHMLGLEVLLQGALQGRIRLLCFDAKQL